MQDGLIHAGNDLRYGIASLAEVQLGNGPFAYATRYDPESEVRAHLRF